MSNSRRLALTVLVIALGSVLMSLTQVVPIAMEPWQTYAAASTIVATLTAAVWFGAVESRHRGASWTPNHRAALPVIPITIEEAHEVSGWPDDSRPRPKHRAAERTANRETRA